MHAAMGICYVCLAAINAIQPRNHNGRTKKRPRTAKPIRKV